MASFKLHRKTGWAQAALICLMGFASGALQAESTIIHGSDELKDQLADLPQPHLEVESAWGSSAPNLSKSSDGTIVLSWLEPVEKHIRLRFSHLTKEGWSAPRTVAESDSWFVNGADFPSVVAISKTLWAAHWLNKKPGGTYAYDVNIALSQDAGESWGKAITPHHDNTATEHGFVSLFPWQQGVGAIWLDGRNTAASATDHEHDEEHGGGGMTLRSSVILPHGEIIAETEMDALVCDCCQTSVAVARQGPVAVYRNRTDAEIRDIYLARSIDKQWQPGQSVHNDSWKISGCPVNGPAVAASGDTVVVAWFTMAEDVPRVRFARSEDGGISFPQVLTLAEESPTGRVDVALLDDGRAAISWLDEIREDQTGAAKTMLNVQIILANGKLGPLHSQKGGKPNWAAGFPQMVSDTNDLIQAWTDTQGPDTRIRSRRIPLSALDNPDKAP